MPYLRLCAMERTLALKRIRSSPPLRSPETRVHCVCNHTVRAFLAIVLRHPVADCPLEHPILLTPRAISGCGLAKSSTSKFGALRATCILTPLFLLMPRTSLTRDFRRSQRSTTCCNHIRHIKTPRRGATSRRKSIRTGRLLSLRSDTYTKHRCASPELQLPW